MAFIIECSNKEEVFKNIEMRLKRRGLQIADRRGWEVHGPHSRDFNYQVYVGYAKENEHIFEVVLFPRKVYIINSKWNNCKSEDSIPVL